MNESALSKARFGHSLGAARCPFAGVGQTSCGNASTSDFDPTETLEVPEIYLIDPPQRLPTTRSRQLHCCFLTLGGIHEAAGIYRACWWSGGMVARGARAAGCSLDCTAERCRPLLPILFAVSRRCQQSRAKPKRAPVDEARGGPKNAQHREHGIHRTRADECRADGNCSIHSWERLGSSACLDRHFRAVRAESGRLSPAARWAALEWLGGGSQ